MEIKKFSGISNSILRPQQAVRYQTQNGMNKRGFFFTSITIIVITIFLISYNAYSNEDKKEVVHKRIESLQSYVFSVEDDLPRELYIFGFRTIFLIEKKILESGSYISDIDSSFQEAFFNGTLNGESQDILQGARFSDIQLLLEQKGKKMNVNSTISSPVLIVTQEDPWRVKVELTAHLILEDERGLVGWDKTETYVSYIPIENFADPIYVINTNGMISPKLVKTPYVLGNVENLSLHLDGNYYIASANAPSFFDRLEGVNEANVYGIESLVDIDELVSEGISGRDKSVVDYIYFSSSNPSSCHISGMPSWFKIDSAHLVDYGVSCS